MIWTQWKAFLVIVIFYRSLWNFITIYKKWLNTLKKRKRFIFYFSLKEDWDSLTCKGNTKSVHFFIYIFYCKSDIWNLCTKINVAFLNCIIRLDLLKSIKKTFHHYYFLNRIFIHEKSLDTFSRYSEIRGFGMIAL